MLNADGTGTIQNSNNSSGSTGTTNPGTNMPVDVDFGDEYITALSFDPQQLTLVPEPDARAIGAAAVLTLATRRRWRSPLE